MTPLHLRALRASVLGVIVLAALLFVPAGTVHYWQAWVFIVVFLVSGNAIGVWLALNDPVLLERRKKVGPTAEQSLAQKIIAACLFGGSVVGPGRIEFFLSDYQVPESAGFATLTVVRSGGTESTASVDYFSQP